MSALAVDRLTLAEELRKLPRHERLALLAPLVRDDLKDKSYELLPLGREIKRYLNARRRDCTDSTIKTYEHVLVQLARGFPELGLSDFEQPVGGERLEEFMDERWGGGSRAAFNVNHSVISEFFKWHRLRGRMATNPMELVGRARKPQVHRATFTTDQQRAILAEAQELRDRIGLRLLLSYAIRKGALQKVQFKHFDHQRKRLTIFTKGQKVRAIPIPDPAFWMDLERHILDIEAQADDFLMCVVKPVPFGTPGPQGKRQTRLHRFPKRAMSSTALHRWWYARLNDAGIVAKGTTSGEKMHKARHTAGQVVLDATGDLKLVQKLLGHASIQTTGDIYVDYDIETWAAKLGEALRRGEDAK